MIRVLIMIAAAGFIMAVVCFGAAGLAGGGPWDEGWGPLWTEGPTITRDYVWTGGDSLRVDAPADVEYTQGPTTKLTVTGPQGLLDRLSVEDGRISAREWTWGSPPLVVSHAPTLKIVMTAPNITDFQASGAQTLSIANYKQDQLTIELSGAGEVVARGEAKRSALRIFGAGSADLGGLAADDATVQLSGAGEATIAPKTSADVDISGLGEVTLLTHPATLTQHISGLGSVTQVGGR